MGKIHKSIIVAVALVSTAPAWAASAGETASAPQQAEGTVAMPAASIPFSAYASPEARRYFETHVRDERPSFADIFAARKYYDRWNAEQAARAREIYAVDVQSEIMAGVQVDIVTPAKGVAPENRHRVLINLHGGAFAWGARFGGQAESIPVAALGRIKVVTVDYREGPEHRFPAASEDVAAVYSELLKTYPARNIGIYGCSAGGILTAEALAWFQKHKLPRPGAVGLLCSGAGDMDGDSAFTGPILTGDRPVASEETRLSPRQLPYFQGADLNDPLVIPIASDDVMRNFPPTLIMTATRDIAMSSAINTFNRLRQLGVTSELRLWDGLWHAFMVVPELPESRDAYGVVVAFFNKHLGRTSAGHRQ